MHMSVQPIFICTNRKVPYKNLNQAYPVHNEAPWQHNLSLKGNNCVLYELMKTVWPVTQKKMFNFIQLHQAVFVNRRAAARLPGPGINYTGPREVLLEICHFSFLSNFHE